MRRIVHQRAAQQGHIPSRYDNGRTACLGDKIGRVHTAIVTIVSAAASTAAGAARRAYGTRLGAGNMSMCCLRVIPVVQWYNIRRRVAESNNSPTPIRLGLIGLLRTCHWAGQQWLFQKIALSLAACLAWILRGYDHGAGHHIRAIRTFKVFQWLQLIELLKQLLGGVACLSTLFVLVLLGFIA